jgi:hypothetical protein
MQQQQAQEQQQAQQQEQADQAAEQQADQAAEQAAALQAHSRELLAAYVETLSGQHYGGRQLRELSDAEWCHLQELVAGNIMAALLE